MGACIRLLCSGVLACLSAISPLGVGQASAQYRLSVDVSQVALNVSVTLADGRPALGLQASDFLVYDGDELQQIAAFSSEDRPATVGLVLDNSRSMSPRRAPALEAAAAFLEFSHPDDDFFVIHLNESICIGLDEDEFSADRNRVRRVLWRLQPDGQTALYDAVEQALSHSLDGRWEKRALLVISDGGDTASSSTFDEVLEMARGVGTPVYGIGVYDPNDPGHSRRVVRRLANVSGGAAFFPHEETNLREICRRIAEEIRNQYTIAFKPNGMGSQGEFHKIRVRIQGERGKDMTVRTRQGYYEPSGL